MTFRMSFTTNIQGPENCVTVALIAHSLETDIDTLTPVEALMKLNEIKRMLQRNASVKLKK